MATAPKKVTTTSAAKKLELSRVSPLAVGRETMGEDVDIMRFALYLSSQVKTDVVERITGARISRTIDASSLLTVNVNDYDRNLLNSGLLSNQLDVEIDGLWFRLTGVDINTTTDELVLSFEDREIAILRKYSKWKVARRSKVTRAQFILNLIREVKELQIPVVIPQLRIVQPIERFTGDVQGQDRSINMNKGVPKKYNEKTPTYGQVIGAKLGFPYKLMAGESPATKENINNANIILQVADQLGAKRKIKVVAIMTAIHESRLRNLPYGDRDSLGLFQQRANWGSAQERLDPATSSKLFINMAMKRDAEFGGELGYYDLCYAAQFQGDPAPWGKGSIFFDNKINYRQQGEQWVSAYGSPGGDTDTSAASANGMTTNINAGGEFFFYRGKITNNRGQKVRKPENSWTCIQRLSDEVDYRAFFRSGIFYYISEDDLFKQEPLLTMTEWTAGVRGMNGNFYMHKKAATLTVDVDVGRWSVPPGSVVVVQEAGPWNGRWIVSEYNRDLFDMQATISLSRERPELPEPLASNADDINTSWVPKSGKQTGTGGGPSVGDTPNIQGFTQDLAQALMNEYGKRWFDTNGRGLAQMQKLASGMKLANPFTGAVVDQDARTLKVVLWLIKKGYKIGTYAWTEDHDGTNDGHAGRGHVNGFCVDIEYINGNHINANNATIAKDTFDVCKLLNTVQGELHPRQLICGGYGNVRNFAIGSLTIPSQAYYGEDTMNQHTNHIHVGY